MTLSVIIIAKNEAHHLRNCLDSVTWADEIIVLDSGSEDHTVAIAREYTPKVFETDWQGFGVQKQRALAHVTGDWVLNLDADECVDPELKQQIISAMNANEADAYRIPIQMWFYGKPLRFSSSPQHHIRLFKRAGAKYSEDYVHEKIQLPTTAKIGRIRRSIVHHCLRDMTHAIDKLNLYATYSAEIRNQNKRRPSLLKTMGSSAWMFIRCYVLQGGFLDGKPGFVIALYRSHGSWYRGIKQLYRDQPR
ncbi:MAG: glycosyltransferase family 2 protein [Gammaproteobacteria bacterium]|nr:glycosyltransferase family 2 protein [Gammaproteobacteria bacterium]